MSLVSRLRHVNRTLADASPTPKQRLPEVIQFPVNDICNSRCQMCFIWRNKRCKEIQPDEIREHLASPVFSNVRGVGLNGGEPTLRKDLGAIAQALIETLPNLEGLSLITNAWKADLACARIDDLASACSAQGKTLGVMVSLDGVGAVHDRVRGREGNFESACKVIEFARAHAGVDDIRIGCTIIRENAYGVEDLLEWARKNDIYARFRLGVPHQRLYNLEEWDQNALDPNQVYHVCAFLDQLVQEYEQEPMRKAFYVSLRNQLAYGAERSAGCIWRNKGVTLLADGGFGYCAVKSKTLGNVVESDPEELFWANADHLREIQTEQCNTCMHDYEGYGNRRTVVRTFADRTYAKLPAAAQTGARTLVRSLKSSLQAARVEALRQAVSRKAAPPQTMRSNRILLTGWYGTETAGDKAILASVVEALRSSAPNLRMDVTSLVPYVTAQTSREMPELGLDGIHSIGDARRRIKAGDYDAVVIAGGPLMSAVNEVISLAEMFADARKVGTRRIVMGCGIGPLDGSARDRVIGQILDMSDHVLLRDVASYKTARKIMTGRPQRAFEVTMDPALTWAARRHNTTEVVRKDTILLALRDWPASQYAPPGMSDHDAKTLKRRFEREIVEMVRSIHRMSPTTKIEALCMNTHVHGGDDRDFFRHLFRDAPDCRVELDNLHRTPGELVARFQQCRGAIAMRFHSAVFALASETPFLAIDYTFGGKIKGLLSDLGHDEKRIPLTDFDGPDTAERLLSSKLPVVPIRDAVRASQAALELFARGALSE